MSDCSICLICIGSILEQAVADHGSITPAECRELLGLGESNTDKVTVSKLLRKWSGEEGFLIGEGASNTTHYKLET